MWSRTTITATAKLRPIRPDALWVGEPTEASALNDYLLCAHEESNLDLKLRKLLSYPLNDERIIKFLT